MFNNFNNYLRLNNNNFDENNNDQNNNNNGLNNNENNNNNYNNNYDQFNNNNNQQIVNNNFDVNNNGQVNENFSDGYEYEEDPIGENEQQLNQNPIEENQLNNNNVVNENINDNDSIELNLINDEIQNSQQQVAVNNPVNPIINPVVTDDEDLNYQANNRRPIRPRSNTGRNSPYTLQRPPRPNSNNHQIDYFQLNQRLSQIVQNQNGLLDQQTINEIERMRFMTQLRSASERVNQERFIRSQHPPPLIRGIYASNVNQQQPLHNNNLRQELDNNYQQLVQNNLQHQQQRNNNQQHHINIQQQQQQAQNNHQQQQVHNINQQQQVNQQLNINHLPQQLNNNQQHQQNYRRSQPVNLQQQRLPQTPVNQQNNPGNASTPNSPFHQLVQKVLELEKQRDALLLKCTMQSVLPASSQQIDNINWTQSRIEEMRSNTALNDAELNKIIAAELLASRKLITVFSGKTKESFTDWLFNIERYFKKANTLDKNKVDFALDHLAGCARNLFISLPNFMNVPWEQHVNHFMILK